MAKKITLLTLLMYCSCLSEEVLAACTTTGSNAFSPSSGDVINCINENLTENNDNEDIFLFDNDNNITLEFDSSSITHLGERNNTVRLEESDNNDVTISNTTIEINNRLSYVFNIDDSDSNRLEISDSQIENNGIHNYLFRINNSDDNTILASDLVIEANSSQYYGISVYSGTENSVTIDNITLNHNDEYVTLLNVSLDDGGTYNLNNSDLDIGNPRYAKAVRVGSLSSDSTVNINNTEISIAESDDLSSPFYLGYGISVQGSEDTIVNISNGSSINVVSGSAYRVQTYGSAVSMNNTLNVDNSTLMGYIAISISDPPPNISPMGADASGTIVNISNGSVVTGNVAIGSIDGSDLTVTLDGSSSEVTITGTSGTAIDFGDQDDSLTITGDVTINGDVRGDGGSDTVNLIDANITQLSGEFNGFENFNIGGIFSGNSSFTGDVSFGSGSTIAPGNSVGTINIVGNATFSTGSTYDAEYDKSGADLVAATGNVTIANGATLNMTPINTQYSGGDLNIITAGGAVAGTFDTVNYLQSNYGQQITYAADSVSVNYVTPSYVSAKSKASAQTGIRYHEIISHQTVNRRIEGNDDFWVEVIYSGQNKEYKSSDFYNSFNNNLTGLAFGSGKDYDDNTYIGYSIADLHSSMRMDNGDGESKSNSIYASIYANRYSKLGQDNDAIYTAAFTIGYENSDNERAILTNSGLQNADSDSNSLKVGGLLQFSVDDKINETCIVKPKVGVSYLHTYSNDYSESQVGNASVKIYDHDFGVIAPYTSLEFRYGKAIQVLDSVSITPKFEVGLEGEYVVGGRNIDGSFLNSGNRFTLPISKKGSTFATLKTGFDLILQKS